MNVKLIVKQLLISFAFTSFVLFFCEYVIYYAIISICHWPRVPAGPGLASGSVRAMVLSDIHLLGSIRGHWFDKLRREWQMWRSFRSSLQLLSPELVIILGDVFDEGLWASDEDFDVYVNRFNDLFAIDSDNTKLIVVVGNHDIGFHYWTDRYLRRRFELVFNTTDVDLIEVSNDIHLVSINSIALEGDNCYLCVDAVHKMTQIGRILKRRHIFPIVLMHFPLYRESEQICSESDSASDEDKRIRYRERMDCLSRESTDLVLDVLRPRLVLTGHSHYSCVVNHSTNPNQKVVPEWTVASFSWRNNKRPTFLLATITADNYSIYKCYLPNENIVFLIYLFSFLILFCFNIRLVFVKYYTKSKTN